LLVDGARINLAVDKAGKGNWEAITNAEGSEPEASTSTPNQAVDAADDDQAAMKLDIQDISLTNSQVQYIDAQSGQSLGVRDINLHLSAVNTRAEPFPMSLTLAVELEQE